MKQINKVLCNKGYITFLFSGMCAISSGIIVSILQERYGFEYSVTGLLLSLMSIGNLLASFMSGTLPGIIGQRATVLSLTLGYGVGFILMIITGKVWVLMAAFLLVGIAKGCALNNCTVLVGNNCTDRTKGMNILHACYAIGALMIPFIVSFTVGMTWFMPFIILAATGFIMWIVFVSCGFEGKKDTTKGERATDWSFLKNKVFWMLTGLVFCQNAAETGVTGWLVTYYKDSQILSGTLSNYTVSIMWGGTLIARLLIAFVFPIKRRFKALAMMGISCSVLYGALMLADEKYLAIILLFAFAFAMAGANPTAVAGAGKMMNSTSMGVMLPVAGIGAIVMPWIIGLVAESIDLKAGMMCVLVPCIGILIFSILCQRYGKNSEE